MYVYVCMHVCMYVCVRVHYICARVNDETYTVCMDLESLRLSSEPGPGLLNISCEHARCSELLCSQIEKVVAFHITGLLGYQGFG